MVLPGPESRILTSLTDNILRLLRGSTEGTFPLSSAGAIFHSINCCDVAPLLAEIAHCISKSAVFQIVIRSPATIARCRCRGLHWCFASWSCVMCLQRMHCWFRSFEWLHVAIGSLHALCEFHGFLERILFQQVCFHCEVHIPVYLEALR